MTGRPFREDVLAQPENLQRAGDAFLRALREADLRDFDADPIVFTGMGGSFFAVVPGAAALRASGRRAFVVPATEILDPGSERLGVAYVALSQSGRSAETVAAMQVAAPPRLALTNGGDGPLAEACDAALPIGSAPDAGISVLTYTASLLAVAALASLLAGRSPEMDPAQLADLAGRLCEAADPAARRVGERLAGVRAVDAIGRASSFASAGYAALLIRESARVPSALFDTHQYLHGPIEAAEPGTGALLFGNGREVQLARDLAAIGVVVLLVAGEDVGAVEGVEVIRLPRVAPILAPIMEAIPAQLVADHLARCRGLNPGAFRHEQPDTKLPAP